ncbi:sulfatase, partial [bacterium]|nr:sulfatase [bacterium]
MKKKVFFLILISVIASAYTLKQNLRNEQTQPLPNILWITCEDTSPYLGCYGDKNATTPNLDKLASEGTLYSNAYANAPVCAPARFTIISGMYASGAGTHHMRSTNKIPENIMFYPEYLREAGYYCTNNSKTDYNCTGYGELWDESSRTAHYKNRKPGQPFFAIFNLTISHESKIHQYNPDSLIHNPDEIELPPYHPDLPEVRSDWARFYDNITTMDKQAGVLLKELEYLGLRESTIVFFYGDHGGVLPRSKRFIFNTGTQVPFITRIPELYKDLSPGTSGNKNERLVSFVDLAPTLLSLAGIPKPDNMQGGAFLGKYTDDKPDYVYFFRGRMDERYDMMRGITDGHYRYIINFMPHRPYGQHISYLWKAASMQVWEKAYLDGLCNEIQSKFFGTKPFEELYDTEADPWEVFNLAGDQEHADVLKEMRQAMKDHILKLNDGGFIPEGEYANIESTSLYDYFQS